MLTPAGACAVTTPSRVADHLEARSRTAAAKPVVFIVDDDISVCAFLRSVVESAGWRSETFASAREFLSRPRALVPSCLVLDVGLPDLNGLDVQQRIVDRHDLPIIFMTGSTDVTVAVRAMKAGAAEFLIKPCRFDVVLEAIGRAVERSSAALRLEAEIQALRGRYAELSSREREVMALVVAGRLNKQVAGELDIAEITVKGHRGNVMRKMNARSLPDLVTMAALLGLLPEPAFGDKWRTTPATPR
jgi:FixJ family two-component response regulator